MLVSYVRPLACLEPAVSVRALVNHNFSPVISFPPFFYPSPEQTRTPGLYGVDLSLCPGRPPEPRGQFAAIKEFAFLGLDGAQFGAGVAADCTVGVCC